MTRLWRAAVFGGLLLVTAPAVLLAQSTAGCLTPAQVAHNQRIYDLARRTSIDDAMPLFDPGYFVGTWRYEWDGPDSPLGPGGSWRGTLVYRHVSGCDYEGQLRGEDGDGKPFSRTIRFTFDAAQKQLRWSETDSHGYTIAKNGPVGGELGGVFQHHWQDGTPFTVAGARVRVKGTTVMPSPAMHRMDMFISVDDAPPMRFGTAMFTKEPAQ